jgi:hypothetical protein
MFVDGVGNVRRGVGTGFWITLSDGEMGLVTNRHNLDPEIKFPGQGLELRELKIEVRKYHDDYPDAGLPETRFFTVDPDSPRLLHRDADCAVLPNPKYVEELPSGFKSVPWNSMFVADNFFYRDHVELGDPTMFVGFAGRSGAAWWDTAWTLPIARQATIASTPNVPFSNPQIPTKNVLLVSGLSFQGSSGSPVFMGKKVIPDDPDDDPLHMTLRPQMTDVKIIGIMSGHFQERVEDEADMFRHTGLSYFTRSQAIQDLIMPSMYARAMGLPDPDPSDY